MITLRLLNYRCFSEESQAEVRFGDGFVALLGPNNSGKTALLRSFFELRDVFAKIDAGFGTLMPAFVLITDAEPPGSYEGISQFVKSGNRPAAVAAVVVILGVSLRV